MSIRFGVSPIAWANDDMPELGGNTPLEDILRDIEELGFEGVELGGKFPRDAATLKPLLARHSLDLIGGWYSGALLEREADAEVAALQEHLALLKAMGSEVFVFAETSNAVHGSRGTPMTGTSNSEFAPDDSAARAWSQPVVPMAPATPLTFSIDDEASRRIMMRGRPLVHSGMITMLAMSSSTVCSELISWPMPASIAAPVPPAIAMSSTSA